MSLGENEMMTEEQKGMKSKMKGLEETREEEER
jgi:hypothetical protein